jgi:hypothetical protein
MAIWLPDSAAAPLPASQVTTSDTSSGSMRASRSGSVMSVAVVDSSALDGHPLRCQPSSSGQLLW